MSIAADPIRILIRPTSIPTGRKFSHLVGQKLLRRRASGLKHLGSSPQCRLAEKARSAFLAVTTIFLGHLHVRFPLDLRFRALRATYPTHVPPSLSASQSLHECLFHCRYSKWARISIPDRKYPCPQLDPVTSASVATNSSAPCFFEDIGAPDITRDMLLIPPRAPSPRIAN